MRTDTIAVDFDGVIHSYTSPWVAPHVIPDPPVEGAIEWLATIAQTYKVVILSTRCRTWRGRRAVRRYIQEHAGMLWYDTPGSYGLGERLTCTDRKVPAIVYVDDRAFRFDGANFPSTARLGFMVPWNHAQKTGGRMRFLQGEIVTCRDCGGYVKPAARVDGRCPRCHEEWMELQQAATGHE